MSESNWGDNDVVLTLLIISICLFLSFFLSFLHVVLSSVVPNYCNVEGYVVDVMSHSFRIVSKEDRLQSEL